MENLKKNNNYADYNYRNQYKDHYVRALSSSRKNENNLIL